MGNLLTISRTTKALFIVGVAFIVGCNPGAYRKPAQDFHSATVSLKQAYFLEWDLSNKARIQKGNLEDQIGLWTRPENANRPTIQETSDRMKGRQQEDIHEGLKPLREIAFAAIEGYAGVLVNLASDEPTELMVSEINGLVKDIEDVLKAVKKIDAFSKYADEIESFSGPLGEYVGTLTEVMRIVSAIIRERSIVKIIGKSNDAIIELMSILKTEAVAAHKNTQSQIKTARSDLENYLGKDKFKSANNAIKAAVAKKIADLGTLEKQINDDAIDSAFDAAIKAQGALVKKALLRDAKDWTEQIRAFRKSVAKVKEALEKVNSEM